MAEEEPKRTRRAQRRAAKGGDAPSEDTERDDEPREERPRAAQPAPPKKKKTASAEEIRDRNRRLREEAAQRRRQKRQSEESAAATGLDASEMVDDALARSTHAVTSWLKQHFNIVQWVVVLGIVGGIGWQIYSWRKGRQVEKASDVLITGLEAEQGVVEGQAATARIDEEGAAPRTKYPTDQARLEAAARGYREAMQVRPGSGTAVLARLGLAGVLLDQGKFDEARQEYDAVKTSEVASKDSDVRGRALEGLGFSLEGKGNHDAALKAFRELENLGALGFDALGMYHQARLHFVKKENDKAKQLAQKVVEKIEKGSSATWRGSHLARAARELLYTIDPSAAGAASPQLSPEAIEELKKEFLKDPSKMQKMLEDMAKPQKMLEDMAKQQGVPAQGAPVEGTPPAGTPPAKSP